MMPISKIIVTSAKGAKRYFSVTSNIKQYYPDTYTYAVQHMPPHAVISRVEVVVTGNLSGDKCQYIVYDKDIEKLVDGKHHKITILTSPDSLPVVRSVEVIHSHNFARDYAYRYKGELYKLPVTPYSIDPRVDKDYEVEYNKSVVKKGYEDET